MRFNTLISYCLAFLLIPVLLLSFRNADTELHVVNVQTSQELQDLLRYTKDRIPLVSAHRGGPRKGFPENCIATFENTLKHAFTMMEIDPHYTKDSAIVLMHDKTLERTSNGSGNVSDYTLAELKKLRLKDTEGNLTEYHMPTLDETLEWAKGKTILVLDQKDVPIEKRVKKIEEHHAEANAMVIVYSFEDAKKCYALNKNIMMEVMLPDIEKCKEFDQTGVPWKNVIAFITHTKPNDLKVFNYIHNKGTLIMWGSSRTIDKDFMKGEMNENELIKGYQQMISQGGDIIEADLGIEAGKAMEALIPTNSSKRRYFVK